MDSLSGSLDSLKGNNDAYSVTANFDGSNISTNNVTGDRESGLFKNDDAEDQMMDFLTLLTAQLQNQDPLSPMENTEFVSQLAQFSQLESTTNMDKSMGELADNFGKSLGIQDLSAQSATNAAAVSLVGKSVRLRQAQFTYQGESEMEFKVNLGERSKVDVDIFNSDQEVIATIPVKEKDLSNSGTFTWDGRNQNGIKVELGEYGLEVQGQETNSALYCFVEDVVESIRYTGNGPIVKVGGKELPVGNILEVQNGSSTLSTGQTANSSEVLTLGQAVAFQGKTIKTKSLSSNYKPDVNGALKTMNIDFAGQPEAKVIIKGADGNVVNTYTFYAADGESIDIPQLNHNGSSSYNVSVEGNNGPYFYSEGEVTGVINKGGIIKLKAGGREISPNDIVELSS